MVELTRDEEKVYGMIKSFKEEVGDALRDEVVRFSAARKFRIEDPAEYNSIIKSLETKHMIKKVEEGGYYSWEIVKDEKNT